MRIRFLFLVMLALALIVIPQGTSPAQAQNQTCFPETSQCVSGRFLEYWRDNGGLPVFGFPITAAQNEVNRDTGQTYLTQWFERNRFEHHTQNQRPYDVLLGRLGDDRLRQLGIDWQTQPKAPGQQAGCLWFQETQHNVCNQGNNLGFKSYWEGHGLEFDGRPGSSYAESLALFGLPLTEPRMETNTSGDTVLTQWFERARFEWHPNNTDQYKVLLGLLGNEVRTPPPPPSNPFLLKAIDDGTFFVGPLINNPLTNGKPNLLLFVTQNWNPGGGEGVYNPHMVAVQYGFGAAQNQWWLFNTELVEMNNNAAFNVLALEPSANVFMHKASDSSIQGDSTIIDSAATNDNPNALIFITQNNTGDTFNYKHNLGVWYDTAAKKWAIFAEDKSPMVAKTNLNVRVVPSGGNAFAHISSGANIQGNATYIDSPATNGKPNALLFVTPNGSPGGSGKTYHAHPVGVKYDAQIGKWAVFNEDQAAMTANIAFNIEVYN